MEKFSVMSFDFTQVEVLIEILIERYFCAVYDHVEKLGFSKGYQNPKRKLRVTTHFSEIIELLFGKKLPYILCILTFFGFMVA